MRGIHTGLKPGGASVRSTWLPYSRQWVDEEDIRAVVEVLRSDWVTTGPKVQDFERAFANAVGAKEAVAVSSGTAGLHAALFALGVGPGDEVIVPALTFVGTANAILYVGGTPVFADIDPASWNIDPTEVLRRITPRTRAILPVHFGGLPCPLEEIHRIAQEKRLIVIEDACHALGGQWRTSQGRWERIGSLSHSEGAVFSFHPVKQITTGEGGMVVVHRKDLGDRLRAFRHHGIVRTDRPEESWASEMEFLGYNYRITDFQCALGFSQLRRLDQFLRRRNEIAQRYIEAFRDLGFTLQQFDGASLRHAWHLFVILLPLEDLQVSRVEVFHRLQQAGLGVQVHYRPVHLHPFYRERFSYASGDFPKAESYYERAISLPLFPRMTDEEVDFVIRTVRSVIQRFRKPKVAASVGMDPPKGTL